MMLPQLMMLNKHQYTALATLSKHHRFTLAGSNEKGVSASWLMSAVGVSSGLSNQPLMQLLDCRLP
jgi:hypothetical protein